MPTSAYACATAFRPSTRGVRRLVDEVVARGAAFAHHLDRADERAEILVLERLVAPDRRHQVHAELERPLVARAAHEVAVAVRMGVDETRHEQAVGARRSPARPRARRRPGAPISTIFPLSIEEVGGDRLVGGGVDELSMANDDHSRISIRRPEPGVRNNETVYPAVMPSRPPLPAQRPSAFRPSYVPSRASSSSADRAGSSRRRRSS